MSFRLPPVEGDGVYRDFAVENQLSGIYGNRIYRHVLFVSDAGNAVRGGVASRKVVRRDLLALRKAPKWLAVFGICQVGIVSGSPLIIVYRRGFLGGNLGKRRRCGGRQNRDGQC